MADISGLDEKTRNELAALALELSSNSKTRKGFLKQVKEAMPGTPIPEIETEALIDERLAAANKQVEDLKNSFDQYKAQNNLSEQRQSAKAKFQLSDDDLGKMEKMMVEKQLPADYNWAGQLYRAQAEPAAPTNYGSSGYGPVELPNDEALMKDEVKWSLTSAHTLVDELRKKASSPF